MFEEFDVDVVFDLFPGLFAEAFFEFGEAAFGAADEVADGGVIEDPVERSRPA